VNVRPWEAADQAAAQEFLARHNSLRGARLGDLVHPLDYPALVAETAGAPVRVADPPMDQLAVPAEDDLAGQFIRNVPLPR